MKNLLAQVQIIMAWWNRGAGTTSATEENATKVDYCSET